MIARFLSIGAALGRWRRRRQQPRLLALLPFRDEMRYLPGYFRNVPPEVDGVIALDDGSTDGSSELAASQPSVLDLLRNPPISSRGNEPHPWNEPENRRRLIAAAGRHSPCWLVAVDSDERLERGFRERAHAEIARAESAGIAALAVHYRELWDAPDTYRADGLWGSKRRARLFRYREDAVLDQRALHGPWAPLNSKSGGAFPTADLYLYHLRMLDPDSRRARRERYERLDPTARYQEIGYAYLTDETGLCLERLPAGREYEPRGLGDE